MSLASKLRKPPWCFLQKKMAAFHPLDANPWGFTQQKPLALKRTNTFPNVLSRDLLETKSGHIYSKEHQNNRDSSILPTMTFNQISIRKIWKPVFVYASKFERKKPVEGIDFLVDGLMVTLIRYFLGVPKISEKTFEVSSSEFFVEKSVWKGGVPFQLHLHTLPEN